MDDLDQGAAGPAFEALMTLARLFADPAKLQADMDAYVATKVAAQEARKAVERERQVERAELDARAAELDDRERAIAATEGRWQARHRELDALKLSLSEDKRQERLDETEARVLGMFNYMRNRLLSVSGLGVHYASALNDLPGFDDVVAEILHDHGYSADGAPSEEGRMRIEGGTPEEAVFQNNLPMRQKPPPRGKPQRQGAQPRV